MPVGVIWWSLSSRATAGNMGQADGSPVVYLDGSLEAHNEWEHASHRQTAHPRTAAMKHKT
jgi:hypothetical protein